MNSYNQFISDIYTPLSGVYGDHFLSIDETFEEMPSGLTYCIRPSFNFGDSYQATNLREVENNIIVTFQIFKAHDSNADIVFIAEDIKERLLDYSIFKVNDYNFSIDVINFQKVYDSAYASIAVLIYATKTGKNIENPEPIEDALTFTSDLDGSTIKLSLMAGNVDESGLYYRFKNTGNWSKYTFDTEFTLNKGKIVQFKNTKTVFNTNLNNYAKFIMTGLFKASGNCNSLINYSNTLINSTFISLFEDCDGLLTAPKLPGTDIRSSAYYRMFLNCVRLIIAPDLPATTLPGQAYYHMFQGCESLLYAPDLPATTLGNNCYDGMFYLCRNLLTTPPILPATTLSQYCYTNMFNGCSKIKSGPILPATTLTTNCYASMFSNCTLLTQAPDLTATTLANYCYFQMFYNCTSLTEAPELPATTLTDHCYTSMFSNCTSLTEAPELPATTLANYCYYTMFQTCRSLVTAPTISATAMVSQACVGMFQNCTSLTGAVLPAKTLASQCYQTIFNGCTSLNHIEVGFTNWNVSNATLNWVTGVQTTSGTFIAPLSLSKEYGVSRIPQNWTVQDIEPENPLTLTAVEASTIQLDPHGTADISGIKYKKNNESWTNYSSTISLVSGDVVKFYNSNNTLSTSASNYVKFIMTGKVRGSGNVMSMINYSSLTSFCFVNLFIYCESLLTPPEMPATELANYCYYQMFQGCKNLTQAPVLPATTLVNSCYASMFYNCTSLSSAPELPATTLVNQCYYQMFRGCTNLINPPSILPATASVQFCYHSMFAGCTSLTEAPEILATNVTDYCYYSMFNGCTSLNKIKVHFSTWNDVSFTNWVNGVAASGTFTCPSGLTDERGVNRIPQDWTIQRI